MISSHILAELSDFCTSIGIIEKGRLRIAGSLTDIEAKMNSSKLYRLTALQPLEQIESFLKNSGIDQIHASDGYLEFASGKSGEEIAILLAKLTGQNFQITSFHPVSANLEDLFMKITQGEVA